MAVTLTQLSAFLSVVRRGSVTAAAEELFVTQPSVSAAVAALEREVGRQAARARRPRAPAHGRRRARSRRTPRTCSACSRRAAARRASARTGARATLRISAVTSAGDHVVPPLIRAFRDRHPELDIDLHIGNRSEVFAGLLEHRADVAITGRVPEDERLRGEAFGVNEIVLVTAPDDPLAKRRWVAVEELGGRPWLLREPGSGSRAMAEEWLRTRGLVPVHPHAGLEHRGARGRPRRARASAWSRGRRRRWSSRPGCWARSARAAACRSASGSSCAARSGRRGRRRTPSSRFLGSPAARQVLRRVLELR